MPLVSTPSKVRPRHPSDGRQRPRPQTPSDGKLLSIPGSNSALFPASFPPSQNQQSPEALPIAGGMRSFSLPSLTLGDGLDVVLHQFSTQSYSQQSSPNSTMSSVTSSLNTTPITSPSVASPIDGTMDCAASTATLPAAYHYEKKAATTYSLAEQRRQAPWQDSVRATATLGRTHKSKLSMSSLLGIQQATGAGSRGASDFGSKEGQSDPISLPSPGGARRQGPDPIPLAGRGDIGPVLKEQKALEPIGNLRTSSSISLKLKIPKFRSFGRPKTTSGGPSILPKASSLPQTPLSLRSPIPGIHPRLSNDTFAPGTMQFESPYLIPNDLPNTDQGHTATLSTSPPFSATNSVSTQESLLPLTPDTLKSGLLQPVSPAPSEFLLSRSASQDENNVTYSAFLRDDVPSSVIRSAEFLKSRIRPFPTITQDDMSLIVQPSSEKRRSSNRISRRASLSATSMLSSSSSSVPSAHPSSSSHGDGDDNNHRYPQSLDTSLDAASAANEVTSPLSPITFERVPSPQLDPTRIPVAELAAPRPPTSDRPNEDDGVPTPTATSHRGMPFPANTPSHLSRHTTRSKPGSRSGSKHSSSELISRSSTPGTDFHGEVPRQAVELSPEQLKKLEEDQQRVELEVFTLYGGEACVTRYEPKKGWIGIWNRPDVRDVIDGLRELRSPKA